MEKAMPTSMCAYKVIIMKYNQTALKLQILFYIRLYISSQKIVIHAVKFSLTVSGSAEEV